MSDPILTLRLTCPSGGQFYICQGNTTQFLGCCASDPCVGGKGSCPQANVRYASFDAGEYAQIHDQACASATGGSWYTCSGTGLKDPFLGCCASDACGGNTGCPAMDLRAARLSDDVSSAAVFLSLTALARAAVTSSSLGTKSASGTTAKATSSSGTKSASSSTAKSTSNSVTRSTKTSSATGTRTSSSALAATHAPTPTSAVGSQSGSLSSSGSSGLSTGAKAGIGVGCAIAAILLIGVLLFLLKRILRHRRGVVVRGSMPPIPSDFVREAPPTPPHYYDPDQILWSPRPPSAGSNAPPLGEALAATSPATSHLTWSTSATSSPSTGMVSRQTSIASGSTTTNNLAPASPLFDNAAAAADGMRQQRYVSLAQGANRGQYHLEPLETLVELDGTELPASTRWHSPQRLAHRPYKQSGQGSREDKSEF